MKLAILAASGHVGTLIVDEAMKRGFEISAFVRDKNKLIKNDINIIEKDIFALKEADLLGFEVVIDAFGEWKDMSLYEAHIIHLDKILKNNQARLLVVGGAGSLYMDRSHTTRLMDMPDFPEAYKNVAYAHSLVLKFLRSSKLNWVYVSPAALFVVDGAKTDKYKIIGEEYELNSNGISTISYIDYASAMLDLAQNMRINKTRVGVIGLA